MRILGFDSSGLVASVAVVEEDSLIAEYTMNHKKTHSQTLLPMLDEMLAMAEISLDTIDGLAIAAGPGSFTGLRIGSATVKGLALALDIPVIPVPTLEALAYNLWGSDGLICPIMDARRNQVYTGCYSFDQNEKLITEMDQIPMDMEELIALLNRKGRKVIFLGDGVVPYRKKIVDGMKIPYTFAPAHMNRQRAASVAVCGCIRFRQGYYESGDDHKPVYLRVSQAERERSEREKENRHDTTAEGDK